MSRIHGEDGMIDIAKVTTDGPHIGSTRSTKYELRFLHVGPNSVGVECTERGVHGSVPIRLEVSEDAFTEGQVEQIKSAFSLIEEAFRIAHDAKEDALKLTGIDVPRAEVHKLVELAEKARAAARAAELETARIEAENIVKRSEHEELDRNLAAMRASLKGEG